MPKLSANTLLGEEKIEIGSGCGGDMERMESLEYGMNLITALLLMK